MVSLFGRGFDSLQLHSSKRTKSQTSVLQFRSFYLALIIRALHLNTYNKICHDFPYKRHNCFTLNEYDIVPFLFEMVTTSSRGKDDVLVLTDILKHPL